MAYQYVAVEKDGPVTTVTLNRPEVMNALHSDAHFELDEVFNDFAADAGQWVAIVTGAGERAFSAGNDLKDQASGGRMGSPPSGFAGLTSRFDLDQAGDRGGERRRHGRRLRDRAGLRPDHRLGERHLRAAGAARRPGGAGRRPAPAAARRSG